MKVSTPDGKPNINGLRHAKTRFARQEWKHVVSDKLPTNPEIFQANYDGFRRAKCRKLKPLHCRNVQRKYALNDRLPPITEDGEAGFEEAPEAKTHHTKHLEAKIHKAKPRQHLEVSKEFGQGTRTAKINTPSVLLKCLVAIWINHGGTFVVIVVLGTVISSLV